MQKREKILILFKKNPKIKFRLVFKSSIKKKENKRTNILSNKTRKYIYTNDFCYNIYSKIFVNKKFFHIKQKIKDNYILQIKQRNKLLLLNIYFKKKKKLKLNSYEIKKPDRQKVSIKFMLFFINIIFKTADKYNYILAFKIKKRLNESRIKKGKKNNKKRFFIRKKTFKFFYIFYKICIKYLNKNVRVLPYFNRSHSIRTLKFKKIRRK